MKNIYCDNNATTRVAPEVLEVTTPLLLDIYGNPSSLHRMGNESERALRQAAHAFEALVGTEHDIVFTSGGTESDNMALRGIVEAYPSRGNHIVSTPVEHDAVIKTLDHLQDKGCEVTYVPVDEKGRVETSDIVGAMRDDTVLVVCMHANNELGTVYDIDVLAKEVKSKNSRTLFFSDGVQAFGKMPIDLEHIDAYAVSGHKIHAPKGVGALFLRKGLQFEPLLYGGGQQKGFRSGTENIPGIIGFAKAAELAYTYLDKEKDPAHLRTAFVDGLSAIDDVVINSPSDGLWNTVNASFPGIPAEVLLHALEEYGVYVSTGSACSSKNRTSRVLAVCGLSDELLSSALRFSFSRYTTKEDLQVIVQALDEIVPRLRQTTR